MNLPGAATVAAGRTLPGVVRSTAPAHREWLKLVTVLFVAVWRAQSGSPVVEVGDAFDHFELVQTSLVEQVNWHWRDSTRRGSLLPPVEPHRLSTRCAGVSVNMQLMLDLSLPRQ